MKPTHPQIPAKFCGVFPAATIQFPHNGETVTGKTNPFNAVYNGYAQTICFVGEISGLSCSAVEIEKVSLLLDSPLALCHAARWLATRLGMDPGVTAPSWERLQCRQHCCDGATGEMVDCTRPVWSIMGADDVYVIFADCPDPEEWDGDDVRHVPGIGDLTDPAAALAAACLAVGGAS